MGRKNIESSKDENAIQAWKADTAAAGGVSHRKSLHHAPKARRVDRNARNSHCCVGPAGLSVPPRP